MCFGFSVMIAWAATRSKGHLRSVWGHVSEICMGSLIVYLVSFMIVFPLPLFPWLNTHTWNASHFQVLAWMYDEYQSHEWVNKLIFKNENNWRKQNGIPQTNNQVLDWTYNDFKVLGICKLLGVFKNELLWISIDNMVAINLKQLLHEHDTDVIPKWFLQ